MQLSDTKFTMNEGIIPTPQEFAANVLADRLQQFHLASHWMLYLKQIGWGESKLLPATLTFADENEVHALQNTTVSFLFVPYINATVIECRKLFQFFGIRADRLSQRLIEIPENERSKTKSRADDLRIEDFGFDRPLLADIETNLIKAHNGNLHGPAFRVLQYGNKWLAHCTTNLSTFELCDFPLVMNVIIEMNRLYFYEPASLQFPDFKFKGFVRAPITL